ncbi:uncharacterized protein YbjT (DUF2867 family) [Azospirillum fermentarium]|uniref:SDR family oxidoreductase n=1 Tax=Azospirillum fermentarium TaxID=1233114 RepID=UPI0022276761|nr:SDR family oxidoreductase [Azospirillum fermentarium]MCW2246019.1 uncharacterized protein YbjT (DUF2867 family) [Azospirillum fermentarium]
MAGAILVLGATGTVGTPLVERLVALGQRVKAASRAATPVAGAEAVRFDYTDPSGWDAAFDGADRAFVAAPTGTMDPLGMLAPVLTALAARRVKVVLQTALGVDADDSIPYRQAERLLERSGAAFVILRPNWFSDNFRTFWLAGIGQGVVAVPAGEGKSSFIDVRDIAESAAAALTTNRFDGQAFNLTGPEALGYAEAAALLTEIIGRPVAYNAVDDQTFIGILSAAGVPNGYAGFLASIFHPVREGWTAAVSPAVETLTGHPPRSVRQTLVDHKGVFAGS